jgi:S-adenosylmethionine synthetase
VEYSEEGVPQRIDTIVVSTQHDEFDTDEAMQQRITADVKEILIPRMLEGIRSEKIRNLFDDRITYYVNPTGKFVIGGPHGDTGLTGRKIIVDTYGGKGAHGGGAFSGKDPSKVDRSAAYAARHIAKNMVAAGVADEMLVQISYAIGIAQPLSIYVDTYRSQRPEALKGMTDGEIAERIGKLFDLRPASIVKKFGLKNPIFEATASYGHFGNRPYTQVVKLHENGTEVEREIEFFGWERLDAVDMIRKEFGL